MDRKHDVLQEAARSELMNQNQYHRSVLQASIYCSNEQYNSDVLQTPSCCKLIDCNQYNRHVYCASVLVLQVNRPLSVTQWWVASVLLLQMNSVEM